MWKQSVNTKISVVSSPTNQCIRLVGAALFPMLSISCNVSAFSHVIAPYKTGDCISSSSGRVILTRTFLGLASFTARIKKATISELSEESTMFSRSDGAGTFSPNSIIVSICPDSASCAMSFASSIVFPAVIQPGKSGKDTPKSLSESLWIEEAVKSRKNTILSILKLLRPYLHWFSLVVYFLFAKIRSSGVSLVPIQTTRYSDLHRTSAVPTHTP